MDSIKTSGVDPQPLKFSVDIKVHNGEKITTFFGDLDANMDKNLERALNELIEHFSIRAGISSAIHLMPAS
jgi:hypothetical protein